MKKILFAAVALFFVVSSKAQFEQGTKYIGASVTNLGMSYSQEQKFSLGFDATAGYFLFDNVMLKANAGYDHKYSKGTDTNTVILGLGGRYYFDQNGIFLGTGLEYCHEAKSYNALSIPFEAGYCFYLNHYVSIEPAVYYKMSLNDFSDKSAVGLKLGFGFYF